MPELRGGGRICCFIAFGYTFNPHYEWPVMCYSIYLNWFSLISFLVRVKSWSNFGHGHSLLTCWLPDNSRFFFPCIFSLLLSFKATFLSVFILSWPFDSNALWSKPIAGSTIILFKWGGFALLRVTFDLHRILTRRSKSSKVNRLHW